ncbi:hypothetical protein A0H81_07885 [Grifola frondosa]|uniref:BZIP domain-containing protein n=1 Tax=Grifola frondosa TaxID=5627 RepID=A0A1C7M626_GRIFR|nr:hypothetical protein A0H81_07885 [Grifola frondosa]
MSSKRGRKRNDNLPPNRARDVQRAFRARRAAHLQELEQRVAELEEENNTLRAALNIPPANRPALGKGPTGKDKPKAIGHHTHDSIRTDSPLSSASASTNSLSPGAISTALALSPPPGIDQSAWNDAMFMSKDQPEAQSSSSFGLPPPSAPSPCYPPSTSRATMNDLFIPPTADKFLNYPHTTDRPASTETFPNSEFLLPDERRAYSYSHPSFPTQQSPSAPPMPSCMPAQGTNRDFQAFLQTRRSLTEPQNYRAVLNQISHVPPSQFNPDSRAAASALLDIMDESHPGFDIGGGGERRFPRMH